MKEPKPILRAKAGGPKFREDLIAMSRIELRELVEENAERMAEAFRVELAATLRRVLNEAGLAKSWCLKNEAYQRFGRAAVERWIQNGDLRQIKEGGASSSRCRINVADLEACAARFNMPARKPESKLYYVKHKNESL